MAVTIIKKTPIEASTQSPQVPAPKPLEAPTAASPAQDHPTPSPKDQTILEALKEFFNLPPKSKKTLMLVHRAKGTSWKVVSHDPSTGRTKLISTDNIEVNPILRQREVELYYPMWR